eukprot:4374540-Prymnesium_polylepis.3
MMRMILRNELLGPHRMRPRMSTSRHIQAPRFLVATAAAAAVAAVAVAARRRGRTRPDILGACVDASHDRRWQGQGAKAARRRTIVHHPGPVAVSAASLTVATAGGGDAHAPHVTGHRPSMYAEPHAPESSAHGVLASSVQPAGGGGGEAHAPHVTGHRPSIYAEPHAPESSAHGVPASSAQPAGGGGATCDFAHSPWRDTGTLVSITPMSESVLPRHVPASGWVHRPMSTSSSTSGFSAPVQGMDGQLVQRAPLGVELVILFFLVRTLPGIDGPLSLSVHALRADITHRLERRCGADPDATQPRHVRPFHIDLQLCCGAKVELGAEQIHRLPR